MKTCKKEKCSHHVFGGGYCKYHQYMRDDLKARKDNVISNSIHSSKQKMIKPKKANTGELELFKKIWSERPHVSELSGKEIRIFDPHSFHHLLTKQAYPEHRLVSDNIVILTRAEHNAAHSYSWQQLIEMDSKWEKLYDKYLAMKQYGKETTGQ